MSQLIRIDRREPFSLLRREMDSLLDGISQWGGEGRLLAPTWFPLDLTENPDGYEVTAEIPGVQRENIEVGIDRNVLTVRVLKTPPPAVEGQSVHLRERVFGEFSRSITLPNGFDAQEVKASYADGILTVTIPRAEDAKPRRIAIE